MEDEGLSPGRGLGRIMAMDEADYPTLDPKLLEDPVFQRVLADALAIQHRFAAEPVYAKTGKGYLLSEGVDELVLIKEEEASTKEKK